MWAARWSRHRPLRVRRARSISQSPGLACIGHPWRHPAAGMVSVASVAEHAIEPNNRFLREEHRDDHSDQRDDSVERTLEANLVAEDKSERLKNNELRPEQHQPSKEEPEKLHQATGSCLEVRRHPVLDGDRQLQKYLQQHSRQQ